MMLSRIDYYKSKTKKSYKTSHSGLSLKISQWQYKEKITAKNLLMLTFCRITVLHLLLWEQLAKEFIFK